MIQHFCSLSCGEFHSCIISACSLIRIIWARAGEQEPSSRPGDAIGIRALVGGVVAEVKLDSLLRKPEPVNEDILTHLNFCSFRVVFLSAFLLRWLTVEVHFTG